MGERSWDPTEFEKSKSRTLNSVLGVDLGRDTLSTEELAEEFGQRNPRRPRHHCHAHGCEVEVAPKMFMCRKHWYRLRRAVRDAVWAEYTPGQERTKKPSLRYLAVQQLAIGEVAFRPHDEQARVIAAEYFERSEQLRRRAMAEGQGDPLERIEQICVAGHPLGEPHPPTDIPCFHWPHGSQNELMGVD